MPCWIDDPSHAVAPNLIPHLSEKSRTGSLRPSHHAIDIFDIQVDHHGRAAILLRRAAPQLLGLSMQHHHRFADAQHRVQHDPILDPSRQFNRPKDRLAERNLRCGVPTHQHRDHRANILGRLGGHPDQPRNAICSVTIWVRSGFFKPYSCSLNLSTLLDQFMLQNFGPHMLQNAASL
jgi:hypothetical protein